MIPFGTGNSPFNQVFAGTVSNGGILIYDVNRFVGSDRMIVSPSATTFYNESGTSIGFIDDNGLSINNVKVDNIIPNTGNKITLGSSALYSPYVDNSNYQFRVGEIKARVSNLNFYADNFNVLPLGGGSSKFSVNSLGTTIAPDGSGIQNLNASYLASGTVNNGRLPSTISQTNLYGTSGVFNSVGTSVIYSGGLLGGSPVVPIPSTLGYASDTHTFTNYAGSSTYATLNSSGLTIDKINFNTLGSGDWAKLYTEGTEEDYDNSLGHKLVMELGDDDIPAFFIIRRYNDSAVLVELDPEAEQLNVNGTLFATNITIGAGGTLFAPTIRATTKVETNLIDAYSGTTITIGNTTIFNDGFKPNGATYEINWNAGTGRIESLDKWTIGGISSLPPAGSTTVPIVGKPANQSVIMDLYDRNGVEVLKVSETETRAYEPIVINNGNYIDFYDGLGNLVKRDFGSVNFYNQDIAYNLQGNDFTINGENGGDIKIGGLSSYLFYDYSTQRIGINTTTPAFTFDVDGQINVIYNNLAGFRTFAQVQGGLNSAYLYSVDGSASRTNYPYFRFKPASGSTHGNITVWGFSSEADFCLGDGNLGVGTETPQHTIDVNGDAKISSTLYLEGGRIENNSGETTFASDGFLFRQRYSGGSGPEVDPSSMRILANGNVGIGTNSPISKLDVNGQVKASNFFTSSASNDTYYLSYGIDHYYSDYTINCVTAGYNLNLNTTSGALRTNSAVQLADTSGTGSTRPRQKYAVWVDEKFGMELQNRNGTWNTSFITRESDGGFRFATDTNTDVFYIDSRAGGQSRIAFGETGRYIQLERVGVEPSIFPSENNYGYCGTEEKAWYFMWTNYLRVRDNLYGGYDNGSGNFHIDSVEGGGSIYLNWYGGSGGTRCGNGSAGYGAVYASAFTVSSDDRLKHNEEDIVDALGTINKLKVQKYDKTGLMLDANFNGDLGDIPHEKEIGFIAQDIQQIPELAFLVKQHDPIPINAEGPVLEGEERLTIQQEQPLTLNYNGITNLAVQAIQELSAQVELLKQEIAVLKAQGTPQTAS